MNKLDIFYNVRFDSIDVFQLKYTITKQQQQKNNNNKYPDFAQVCQGACVFSKCRPSNSIIPLEQQYMLAVLHS